MGKESTLKNSTDHFSRRWHKAMKDISCQCISADSGIHCKPTKTVNGFREELPELH
jgi:hypothetical protein